jgi:glutamyl-tRNA reductase
MQLYLLGVSHKTAPVDVRERLDFSSRGVERALAAVTARTCAREVVVLSTCNRAELYVGCDDPARVRGELVQFIGDFHQIPGDQLTPHIYEREGREVAQHLFRVAAGLDSLVVGEPQILGQVKEAHSVATADRRAGPLLNRLFHWSFAVGKRVRSETGLGEGAVSVSYAAVALARKIFGELTGLSVLVIGAGEMGKLTVQHLKAHGVGRVAITSRSAGHAGGLAETVDGWAVPWDQLPEALGDADIAVCATGAPLPVLMRAQVEQIMRPRRNRPLFIIDIAVPRDVEGAVGDLEQVFLYNIDDLQSVVREDLSKRAAEIERAERIIAEEVERFSAWMRSRDAVPTVVALRQRFDAIRRSELQRLEPKLAGLSPEARARVDEITRLIVEKLLLNPTEQLKTISDPEVIAAYSEALGRLFSLAVETGADAHSSGGSQDQSGTGDSPIKGSARQ